jgi:hypothetical protein
MVKLKTLFPFTSVVTEILLNGLFAASDVAIKSGG